MMNIRKKFFSSHLDDFFLRKKSNDDLNISWDSSSDCECVPAKRFKSDSQRSSKSTKWINFMNYETQTRSNFDISDSEEELTFNSINNSDVSVKICSQYTEKVCSQNLRPSLSNNDSSPIIGRFIVKDLSPTFRCRSPIISSNRNSIRKLKPQLKKKLLEDESIAVIPNETPNETLSISGRGIVDDLSPNFGCTSPIISRSRNLTGKHKAKVKKKLIEDESIVLTPIEAPNLTVAECQTCCNNISGSSLGQTYFIESSSQDCNEVASQSINSSSCTEANLKLSDTSLQQQTPGSYQIEPFLSQDCNLITNSLPTCWSSSGTNSNQGFVKKRRCKKGGIADQLRKALKKQENDLAILKHELYLDKDVYADTVLVLEILKFWEEFKLIVVLCGYSNKLRESESQSCLVIIGCNVKHDLNIKVNYKLKLYEPYETKVVKYEGQDVNCYFSVSKIFSSK